MKLYEFPQSPNCQKVFALAHEVGVPVENVFVDIFKGGARTPEMLAKNPSGRVPVLEDGDFVLWESNAILGYIAGKADRADLAPTQPRERAEVDRWLAFQAAHFGPAISIIAFERLVKKLANLGAPDDKAIAKGEADLAVATSVLEQSLKGREYLAGRLSIADFSLIPFAALMTPCGVSLDPYPNVKAWVGRMLARPSVKRALGQ